jgi:hypothetical protein
VVAAFDQDGNGVATSATLTASPVFLLLDD